MTPKLDREQRHTLAGILAVAAKKRAPEKDVLSAIETALVETGLRNPKSAAASGPGSGSSVGWRQETASSYPGVNRANVHGAAKRFFDELGKAPAGSAGKRAQAVQRSAYPGRYDQAEPQAKAILKAYGGKNGRVADALHSSGMVSGTIPGSPNPVTGADSSITDLLAQTVGAQQGTGAMAQPPPLTPPNFSARYDLRTPSGAPPQLPESGPIQQTQSQADQVLQQLAALGAQDVQDTSLGSSPSTRVSGTIPGADGVSGSQGGPRGTVKVAPGADRSGVSTQPIVKKAVAVVAGKTHHPITITTGTNHNRMTVNGNVSDHWTGHAADIGVPVDSHQGDLIAASALEQLAGVAPDKARQMVRQGGLWTYTPKSGPVAGHRIQIIWRTYEGGNHHNHVHIGVR